MPVLSKVLASYDGPIAIEALPGAKMSADSECSRLFRSGTVPPWSWLETNDGKNEHDSDVLHTT
jgi:hypothetical protein